MFDQPTSIWEQSNNRKAILTCLSKQNVKTFSTDIKISSLLQQSINSIVIL